MDNILFVINPIAGGGKALETIPLIEETMDGLEKIYDIVLTENPGEATDIARKMAEKYSVIAAVGGDGTINEVAKGLLEAKTGTMGIIPAGTGNDMVRSLKIPLDPKKSLKILIDGNRKDIDIGSVNGTTFLNIASIGYDADTIANHSKFKEKIKGKIVYFISVVYTIFNFKKKDLEIYIDDKKIEEEVVLLAIGNGMYYGGGFQILPMAELDDNKLHVCIVSGLGKLKTMILLPTLLNGKHIKFKRYVRNFTADEVKVQAKEKLYLNIDGETPPKLDEFNFKLSDQKLNIIC